MLKLQTYVVNVCVYVYIKHKIMTIIFIGRFGFYFLLIG